MKWTESTWFKNLCMAIVAIFFSQSVQPMTFGFAPLTSGPIHAKTRQVPVKLASKHLGGKASLLVDHIHEKFKGLDELPIVQNVKKLHDNNPTSCAAQELTQQIGKPDLPSPIPSPPQGTMGKLSKSGMQWLEYLGSFLVSEAHAQTPDPNLESTPGANTTDTFIVQKASELGNDPNVVPIGHRAIRGHCMHFDR